VAVIATIYTAGAAAGMMGATVTGTTGAAAAGGAALAGKALGAVDSFSLIGALTSGLAAGAHRKKPLKA